MFVKTAFQVLKVKFLVCSMKQAFYPLPKQNIAPAWQQTKYCASLTTNKILRQLGNKKVLFLQVFLSVPGCQTCMCKRGISDFQILILYLFWFIDMSGTLIENKKSKLGC